MSFRFEKPKTAQDYIDIVLKCIGLAILVVYFVFFFISFGRFRKGVPTDFDLALYLFSGAGNPNPWIRSLSLILFILSISFVVRLILKFFAKFLKKGGAVLNLLASLIKYAAVIVLIFLVLDVFGVNSTALLVSAGVVSLVIGLGAQSLISDVIAGLFIVFENVFDIGDIIVVDGFRGTVKEIGVRTTQIVDWAGNIKVVNNSDIRALVNMTSELSTSFIEISIEYGESIERVENIIKKNLDRIKEAVPDIIDGPYYKGVSALGESGVSLAFVATCKETVRFQVERDVRRQLKLIFDENDIGIPFPQVTVNQPKSFVSATNKEKRVASEFVEEQKESSRDLPASPNEIK